MQFREVFVERDFHSCADCSTLAPFVVRHSYQNRLCFKLLWAVAFIALFALFTNAAFCQNKKEKPLIPQVNHGLTTVYTIGGKSGWADVLVKNGVAFEKGRYGNSSIELDTNSLRAVKDVDMLLSFEEGKIEDRAGNYIVKENNLYNCSNAIMGNGVAFSRDRNGGIVLSGREGAFFSSAGRTGSFVIDFYLCPSIVDNGEIILNWRSSRQVNSRIIYQHISFIFNKDTLMCIFSNIFDGYEKDDSDVYLSGDAPLIPGKWSHHLISYNDETGCLLYTCDDVTQDITFITSNGHESGSLYPAILGTKASVELCPKYTGLIDDFCIARSYVGAPQYLSSTNLDDESYSKSHYVTSGGRFETLPIMIKAGTTLERLCAIDTTPKQTEVQYYVRSGDNQFNWTSDYPQWKKVTPGQKISGVTGLYFQVACNLFSDGEGNHTPKVSQIDLVLTPMQTPRPPYKLNVLKGDRSVTLKWSASTDENIGGYYVYYGTKSGEYLGKRALEGSSPVDVGDNLSCTLQGLQNGKIYYFAVASYSAVDENISGDLSREVYARPCAQ